MEILLRHKRKNDWSGVVKYKGCFSYISPAMTRSGNIHTGLTDEDARRLEKALGMTENNLAPYSAYWHTFAVKVPGTDVVLDTERPWDELQYLFLRNHYDVAYGVADDKPKATFVLINKDAEATEVNKINKRKREAIREFDKMSLEDMRKCLRIFGIKSDNISNELVESKMFEIVEKSSEMFFSKWVNNKVRGTEFMIQAAIAKNIMRKNKNAYYYGTDIIGTSLDDAIAYLDDKKNQEIKMTIANETESK